MSGLRIPTAAEVAAARAAKRQRGAPSLFQPSELPLVAATRETPVATSLAAASPVPNNAAASSSTPSAPPPLRPLPAAASLPTTAPLPAAAQPAAATPAAAGPAAAAAASGKGAVPPPANTILVSRRQQGNPILRAIRNVPWTYGDTSADYVLSETTCCLFLSLRYHLLHPEYLTRRLRELSAGYTLRLVLLLVDSDDAERPVLEVTRLGLLHDCTTLLAWSAAEAARYLETLRAYAKKPADMIKERTDGAFSSQLAECLTSIRTVNKTDAATLHNTFGSLAAMMNATHAQLATCPGLGEKKVRRLRDCFLEPFVPDRARGTIAPPRAADQQEH